MSTDLETQLSAAMERGNFAEVRRLCADAGESDRALAEDYLQRVAPPPAARFAWWATFVFVLLLSGWFVATRH